MPRNLGDLISDLRGGYTNARNYLGDRFMSTGGPPGDPRATGLHEAFSGNLAGTLYPYLGQTGTRAAVDTAGFVNELVGGGSEFAGGRPFFSDRGFDWGDIGANYRGIEAGMAPFAPTGITRTADDYLPPVSGNASQDFDPSQTITYAGGGSSDIGDQATIAQQVLPVDPRFATTNPDNPFNQTLNPNVPNTTSNPTLDRTMNRAGMGSNVDQQIDPVASRDAFYQSAVDDVLGGGSSDPASEMLGYRNPGGRGGAGGSGAAAGGTQIPAASGTTAGAVPLAKPQTGVPRALPTGPIAPTQPFGGESTAMSTASAQYPPGSLGAMLNRGRFGSKGY